MLAKGVPSPLAKESDEEKAKEEEAGAKAGDAKKATAAKADATKKAEDEKDDEEAGRGEVRPRRPLRSGSSPCPSRPASTPTSQPGPANQLFYRRAASTDPDADAAVYRYDLEKRKEDTLLDKADGFALSRRRASAPSSGSRTTGTSWTWRTSSTSRSSSSTSTASR